MRTFEFSMKGLEEAKLYKPWYMKRQNYVLAAMTISYIGILAINISTGTVGSMGSVEDSLIKAFKIKSVGL